MPSTNYSIIKNAIQNKLQVSAYYNGHYREMCPHSIGMSGNTERAMCCLFGGTSETKGMITPETREWRCITIDKLSNLETKEGDWYTLDISGKTNNHSCITEIDLEIACNTIHKNNFF